MEAQQFHLKWNNHSLNTLSSFQHLLDTSCLVDVSLTCSTGKIVPAHRMVLAACSDYFYRLFKDLPEKHPVIVFKDASEQILQDLLEFMYRGEVEVDEANLSDFLKFADTLQVKGLSQSENQGWKGKEDGDVSSTGRPAGAANSLPGTPTGSSTPGARDTPPAGKDARTSLPEQMAGLNKNAYFTSALAGLPQPGKFPAFFPALNGDPVDLYSHLASPTLFNALKRKYPVALGQKPASFVDPESPVLKMPFLKDYFAKHPLDLSADPSRPPGSFTALKDEDSDGIAEPSPPPAEALENGSVDNESSPGAAQGARLDISLPVTSGNEKTSSSTTISASRKPQGRGSRLERMIAAEYKILSEYSDQANSNNDHLPAITPELMKSRRTHSLQLAIGEILHNKASVQSAATKYHIPRETLRRHYQRYLKAMGIQKEPGLPGSRQTSTPTKNLTSSMETLAAAAAASAPVLTEESSGNSYSSLLDIGQAYGIWAPGEENSNDMPGPRDLKIVEDEDDAAYNDTNLAVEVKEELKDKTDDTQEDKVESSTATESQNNNNVTPDKPGLSTPRILPLETALPATEAPAF